MYCDAGATLGEDDIASAALAFGEDYANRIRAASGNLFQNDALKYSTKQYDIQLKPLFSAFHWRTLGLTSLRSFLLFYLPLLEPRAALDDDDADFLKDDVEEKPLDLVSPFKKSVKQIFREVAFVSFYNCKAFHSLPSCYLRRIQHYSSWIFISSSTTYLHLQAFKKIIHALYAIFPFFFHEDFLFLVHTLLS